MDGRNTFISASLRTARNSPALLHKQWAGPTTDADVGWGRGRRYSVQSRVHGRSNLELGFLGSHLYKRQDAMEVVWSGHTPLPPSERAKGQGKTLCGLPGLTLPPSLLACSLPSIDAWPHPLSPPCRRAADKRLSITLTFKKWFKKSSRKGQKRGQKEKV